MKIVHSNISDKEDQIRKAAEIFLENEKRRRERKRGKQKHLFIKKSPCGS
jgi:hypothetical protein